LVIGAAGLDLVGRLRADLQPGTSNPARIRASFGGVARNVAENLVRLGQPVNLITVVGDDDTGERLLKQLSELGVDTHAVLCTTRYPTGSYIAAIDAGGALQFALDDMRAISDLSAAYINQHVDLFRKSSLLVIDANLPRETLRAVMSQARQARLPVCADPTSNTLAPKLAPYLSRLFLINPNKAEAAIYYQDIGQITNRRQALQAAKHLVGRGVQIALVTLAELGLCYATSETSGYIPAIRTEIADPTGAGDALTAAVIFALLNDIPLDDAVRLGVSAASLTLQHPGAVLPDLSLEKLYDHLVI